MKIENIIKAKLRNAIAELNPVLKRKLTTHQMELVNEAFAIAAEVLFDSLQEILEGKQPDFVFEALTEEDIDDMLETDYYDDAA